MIDSDPYGFAVRPFYNQEGNEYAVLFPLCAWNPVNGDGWIANSYWNRRCFGAAPFFHHSRGAEAFSYYALAWRHGDSWGVFPFARFGRGFSYAGPAWWSRNGEGGLESGGFFPMARFHRDFNFFGPAWWYRGGHVSWGVFPAARFSSEKDSLNYVGPFWRGGDSFGLFPAAKYSPKGISYAGPFWKDRSDGTFGIFPVFRFRNVLDHFLFPLYCIGDNGGFFLSPLAAWEKDRMFSILGPLYLVNRNRSEIRDDGNPMFYRGGGKSESCFRMFGLVGYAGSRSVCNWKKECDLTKLKTARVRDFAGHRPYLQYMGSFVQHYKNLTLGLSVFSSSSSPYLLHKKA